MADRTATIQRHLVDRAITAAFKVLNTAMIDTTPEDREALREAFAQQFAVRLSEVQSRYRCRACGFDGHATWGGKLVCPRCGNKTEVRAAVGKLCNMAGGDDADPQSTG